MIRTTNTTAKSGIWAGLLLIAASCTHSTVTTPSTANTEAFASQERPNIILFYVDDLGFGDLSSYGAKRVSTPNVDKLVKNGLKFTDGHSPAATCTPSRYSLLTGEYAFRNRAAILPGDAPLLIDTSKLTLPKVLRKAGYTSAVVGKWHLGLGNGNVDWNQSVAPGPLETGFDYSFLLPATGDRVPTVYLENHKVVNLGGGAPLKVSYEKNLGQERATRENARYLSDKQHSRTLVNGVGRIGAMIGGEEAYWTDEDFPFVFTEKAVSFMEQNKRNPFFLFFSFHDIHVPRLPNEQFKNTTDMGPRGDAIVQMDWMTGRIMDKLEELGLAENTLVIFTSDNGPVLNDGYADFAEEMLGDHMPSGPYRGGKYSAYEAGTRVPTITHWPGVVQPGVSDALVSQVDILASVASLIQVPLNENEAIDSENLLGAFLGNASTGREYLLEESHTFSLRKNHWKYIQPIPRDNKAPSWMEKKGIETGFHSEPQLYNLEMDVHETVNVVQDYPDLVTEMEEQLNQLLQSEI